MMRRLRRLRIEGAVLLIFGTALTVYGYLWYETKSKSPRFVDTKAAANIGYGISVAGGLVMCGGGLLWWSSMKQQKD